MFWLFSFCLAVVNLFSHCAAAVFSAKTNLGSHRCAAPCVRDSWALGSSIKLPAHERETWIVVLWDDKRSWSPEQTLPGRGRRYWHALVWTLKENTQILPHKGKPQGCMTRAAGLCSDSVPACARLPLPCPQGRGCSCTPGCWATWQPGQCCGQLPAWGMARAACHTHGESPLLSHLQTLQSLSWGSATSSASWREYAHPSPAASCWTSRMEGSPAELVFRDSTSTSTYCGFSL